ncbi:hypothetical protein CP556_20345 [Natrinema sp. CBA1119]|uniref:hypothetical protein n=1 Tax=Natrinema sp. CBA1119 TaxID=1608465 RepID=UPI000BF256B9|nr:hypothetical protein [Natrinema sp. CBA1119]PGF14477.1 hypothetical protein CP556_20345 [Natrinema sp. CBA1119]
MKASHVALVGVIASLAINGAISATTNTATYLAVTPVGIAVYLIVGIGGPQTYIGQQNGSSMELGMGVLAIVAGLVSLGVGVLGSGVLADWGTGFVNLLLILVLGIILWAGVRQFAEGYSSTA